MKRKKGSGTVGGGGGVAGPPPTEFMEEAKAHRDGDAGSMGRALSTEAMDESIKIFSSDSLPVEKLLAQALRAVLALPPHAEQWLIIGGEIALRACRLARSSMPSRISSLWVHLQGYRKATGITEVADSVIHNDDGLTGVSFGRVFGVPRPSTVLKVVPFLRSRLPPDGQMVLFVPAELVEKLGEDAPNVAYVSPNVPDYVWAVWGPSASKSHGVFWLPEV